MFAVGIILLIFGVIMAIEMPLINWRLRKLKLFIDEDKIVKQCGRKQQIYLWKDIAKIKTVENKNGGVAQIKIYPKEHKMAMYLHGFGQMQTIANLVKERTFDSALHQEKRYKLDWQNPFVSLLVAGVPTMVIMFVIASMGNKAMDIFAIVCSLSVGFGLLMFRPMTKFDVCNKWVESVLGIILIVLGIYGLICFLFAGKIP